MVKWYLRLRKEFPKELLFMIEKHDYETYKHTIYYYENKKYKNNLVLERSDFNRWIEINQNNIFTEIPESEVLRLKFLYD